jgi:hypothetical protein
MSAKPTQEIHRFHHEFERYIFTTSLVRARKLQPPRPLVCTAAQAWRIFVFSYIILIFSMTIVGFFL